LETFFTLFVVFFKEESLHNKVHNQEKAKKNNMDKLEKVKKQKASR